MHTLTFPHFVSNDKPDDIDPRYVPGGLADLDNLPADVQPRDPRVTIHIELRVTRVHDGGRSVLCECPDVYRGATSLPVAWIRPYVQYREPVCDAVYRFAIPIEKWREKRRALLALLVRRGFDRDHGPHDAA